MSRPDDELDTPPTPEELAAAKKVGDLVDGVVAGDAPPAALAVEQRVLLDAARDLHEAGPGMAATRTRAVLDDVFSTGLRPSSSEARRTSQDQLTGERSATRRPLGARTRQVISALAVAAALALAVGAFLRMERGPAPGPAHVIAPIDPDAVLGGPIARTKAGDAGGRIDALVAARVGALGQARAERGRR